MHKLSINEILEVLDNAVEAKATGKTVLTNADIVYRMAMNLLREEKSNNVAIGRQANSYKHGEN